MTTKTITKSIKTIGYEMYDCPIPSGTKKLKGNPARDIHPSKPHP